MLALSPAEVDRLKAACSGSSTSGIRAAAMVALMYGAGLRCSEVLGLMPGNLDLERRAVTVPAAIAKGGKEGTVSLAPSSVDAVRRWLDRRAALGLNGRHRLFCAYSKGKLGQPLIGRELLRGLPKDADQAARESLRRLRGRDPGLRYVRQLLDRLADRAGIDRERCHPHMLRHALACEMERRGMRLTTIQRQLRHSSAAVTARYLRRVAHDPDALAGL